MAYQLDQSGKVEQTERHTVLACINNEESMTLLLKKSEKRKLQELFKRMNSLKAFPYLTFSALIALLIRKLQPKHKIIVDREYVGHEDFIEEKVKSYLRQLKIIKMTRIEFGHVGKLSEAHKLAYQVAVGKKEPTMIVDSQQVITVILGTKKIGIA